MVKPGTVEGPAPADENKGYQSEVCYIWLLTQMQAMTIEGSNEEYLLLYRALHGYYDRETHTMIPGVASMVFK